MILKLRAVKWPVQSGGVQKVFTGTKSSSTGAHRGAVGKPGIRRSKNEFKV